MPTFYFFKYRECFVLVPIGYIEIIKYKSILLGISINININTFVDLLIDQ